MQQAVERRLSPVPRSCAWRCSCWRPPSRPQSAGTTYLVGDAAGWTRNVDYGQWVAGKTFHAGDILGTSYVLLAGFITSLHCTR